MNNFNKIFKTANVPVILQMEELECGSVCLAMILAYYGRWVPTEEVRANCGISRDGCNARNITKAAQYYKLKTSCVSLSSDELIESNQFPCICHWNFDHFVVLDGFKGNNAIINDPSKGKIKVPMDVFNKSFTGVSIFFEPESEFEKGGKPKSVVKYTIQRIKKHSDALIFIIITGIISTLIGVITPGFSRVFMDRLMTNQRPEWITIFFVLLVGISLLQILVTAISNVYSLRMNGKMDVDGSVSYMQHILSLPIEFFWHRMIGDIQLRKDLNSSIAYSLINTVGPLFLNLILILLYVGVMFNYSWILTITGLLAFVINIVVSMIISKTRANINRVIARDSAKLNSAIISGINLIETIKSTGSEDAYLEQCLDYQANVNTNQVRYVKVNQYVGMIPQFLRTFVNYVILILGVYLIMQGEFTVGMVLAFQGYFFQFMAPAQSTLSTAQTINEMRVQIERVEDVMNFPSKKLFNTNEDIKTYEKLSGNLEMKDVCFSYSPLQKPFINNFNLSIKPGESIAIVGKTGCGKSTIAKLITGLIDPRSGHITFDGKKHSEINKDVFIGSVSAVDQEITLFEDTVFNNITMLDSSITEEDVVESAKIAQLHDFIISLQDAYQHMLTENGKDLSGGQRQCLEIARSVAQKPSLLILDEATSALDSKTEYKILNKLNEQNITCIVIAHRLSTIRSCDKIVVMDNGCIVDMGTHDQLLLRCSKYKDLVLNE